MSNKELRSGYTTGTHATAVFVASLYDYFEAKIVHDLFVQLPQNRSANIEVVRESVCHFSTIKGDNDDMDVTKGCKISCQLLEHPPTDIKEQTPSLLEINGTKIFIYAGEGVGVVTKKGLKIAPPHPAINPTPLEMMCENSKEIIKISQRTLYALFCVANGEEIAKETANAKVGVLGGISILGTRGIVKPVSASAYIDSIEAEINVALAQSQEYIVFTLGNSAYDYAKKHYNETSIIEIGNFVYDALVRLQKHRVQRVIFITSVAKMCKVAQGFKNTHNRYGSIDFTLVKEWLQSELGYALGEEEFVTLKGVLQTLSDKYKESFIKLLGVKSAHRLQEWCDAIGVKSKEVQTITLPNEIKEVIQW